MFDATKFRPSPAIQRAPGFSANSPSILLPLRFMVTGLVAFLMGTTLLVTKPELLSTYHYSQYVIAVTHLFVLGWICTIVMGAIYQLVPVALETKLYSERLAKWQFIFHFVGIIGMVWMFWTWNMKQVGHFGSILTLGVGLFVYNLWRTLWRVPRWNLIASAVASALGWLTLVVLAGLTIAAGKCSFELNPAPASSGLWIELIRGIGAMSRIAGRFDAIAAMHAHAHLGFVGVFLMLIVGISYKLIPMFTLSEIQSKRRAGLSLVLINTGLVVSFLTILTRSQYKPVGGLILTAGLCFYGLELKAILRARKRRQLDWGVMIFLTAIGLLGPLAILGLALAWPTLPLNVFTGQMENLYGFLAVIGVVSLAIIGMLYKILPFLVWYQIYSGRIGLEKVPSLSDLYSTPLQVAGYCTQLAAITLTSVGILVSSAQLVRYGSILLASSLVILLMNVAKMLEHFVRPRTSSLTDHSQTAEVASRLLTQTVMVAK
jgi:hypothetical protein